MKLVLDLVERRSLFTKVAATIYLTTDNCVKRILDHLLSDKGSTEVLLLHAKISTPPSRVVAWGKCCLWQRNPQSSRRRF